MRIISGNHRGKRIIAPATLPVRPTTDMAKESLFNILNNYFYFDQLSVLDLCAGTGNISYEFAARGAASVVAVDINSQCVQFIQKTAQSLGFDSIQVVKSDILAFLERCGQQFNVIFADPPYQWDQYNRIPEYVFDRNLLLPDGFLVIEHPKEVNFESFPKFFRQRVYGRVNFSLFAENI